MPKSKPSPTWKALLDQSKVTEAKKAADTLWSEVGQDQAAVYGVLGEAVLAAGDADTAETQVPPSRGERPPPFHSRE